MTDPREPRPETRRMEPIDTGYGGAPGPGEYGYPDAGAPGAPYTGAPYTGGGYPGGEYPGGEYSGAPEPKRSGSAGRTAVLALIALLALALVVLAGYLVFGSRGGSDDVGGGAAASSPTSATTAVSETTTSATTSPTTTTTSASPGVSEVTYQFTGTGNLVGVRYTGRAGDQVVAATGVPWSVRTPVSAASAELTGIVVGGRVTCTITVDGEVLATATSNGGTLACRAPLPN